MKAMNNLQDIRAYGIELLTGEADRLCMRILCDMNEEGQRLVTDFFGLPFNAEFKANWNSQVNGQPSVGCVMLTTATLWELARFAMLSVDQFDVVIETPSYGLRGMNHGGQYTAHYMELAERSPGTLIFRNLGKTSTAPGFGTRNTHAMSGRIS